MHRLESIHSMGKRFIWKRFMHFIKIISGGKVFQFVIQVCMLPGQLLSLSVKDSTTHWTLGKVP